MSEPRVLHEQTDHVVTLTLNRPEELNAFSEPAMIEAFLEALERIRSDRSARAVVLTGAGKAFSAGGNVKHMRDKTDMFAGSAADIERAYAEGIHRVPPLMDALEVPVIAAVNGAAFGAALDLVCLCDIRLAAPEASFGAPFVRIGIAPGDGAAWFLARAVGEQAAAEMLFTGEPIDAEKAAAIGLVSRLVARDRLLGEAQALAAKIAANAPQAVRLTKRLLRAQRFQSLPAHLQQCAAYQAILHGTEDHAEALAAFFEKRPAVFQDR
ncbi:MAG: enoyl-CoA hydratase-related protein [Marivibrio sp.]|uniref:enoyl-CoA hydratase-related protein n=1 Tax=Marivibrio sp. TaxID=2039719 RepID=UPI0032ED05AD